MRSGKEKKRAAEGKRNLVLLEPLLQQVLLALDEDGPDELEGLVLVHLTLLKQDTKILEEGRGLAWSQGDLLEHLNGLGSAENSLWGAGGDLGGLGEVALAHELLEALEEEVLSAGEATPGGQADGQVGVVQGVDDVGDHVLLINAHGENLSLPVDTNHAVGGLVVSGDEDGVA